MAKASFSRAPKNTSSIQQQPDNLLLLQLQYVIEDAYIKSLVADSDGDSSENDSDQLNALIEDSFVVECSSSTYKYEQQDEELYEAIDLISVMERNFNAVAVTKRAIACLSELAKSEDNLKVMVQSGIVPALLNHLQDTQWPDEAGDFFATAAWPVDNDVEDYEQLLSRLLHLMHNADKIVQRRILSGLAQFCSSNKQEEIFVDNNGLNLLLENLKSFIHRGEACAALCKLAKRTCVSPVDAGPPSLTSQVFLGEKYVNNSEFSDVTFMLEGKVFFAHRIVLVASSDAFRAMFDGGYKERDAKVVQIPNIRWETFELMMRFIYTGSVEVNVGIAQDLLKAADQYLLDGLKRLCEYTMARDIKADNLRLMYDLSETYNAVSLRNACILFVLDQFDKLHSKPWYASFLLQILPEIRNYFMTTLTKPMEVSSQE
ncbi:ARM repeat protein interacting with ABF2 [Artemisia annua]|uniref:ARM repeat protein interacting with ABF2 n=1 Tax=Artemisia annua TaxID=35608 RepID=A0A2U1NL01_ARTAN|nr:ARM repeat protein interacting with ABF2 [Artemisia annua]